VFGGGGGYFKGKFLVEPFECSVRIERTKVYESNQVFLPLRGGEISNQKRRRESKGEKLKKALTQRARITLL